MRADLDDEILDEILIINSNKKQGFELFFLEIDDSRKESLNLVGDASLQNSSASITHHGSTMMSSSPSKDVREPLMQERGTTLMKPVLNTSLLKLVKSTLQQTNKAG